VKASLKSGDIHIKKFDKAMERCFGAGGFPREMLGDLADLRLTLPGIVRLLREIGQEEDAEVIRAKLFHLSIVLEQDLPMIIHDLVPEIKQALGTTDWDK
jgi:hypothetical protein